MGSPPTLHCKHDCKKETCAKRRLFHFNFTLVLTCTEATLYSDFQTLPDRTDGLSQQTKSEQSQSWRNRDGSACYEGETQKRDSQQWIWCESHVTTNWPCLLSRCHSHNIYQQEKVTPLLTQGFTEQHTALPELYLLLCNMCVIIKICVRCDSD